MPGPRMGKTAFGVPTPWRPNANLRLRNRRGLRARPDAAKGAFRRRRRTRQAPDRTGA